VTVGTKSEPAVQAGPGAAQKRAITRMQFPARRRASRKRKVASDPAVKKARRFKQTFSAMASAMDAILDAMPSRKTPEIPELDGSHC